MMMRKIFFMLLMVVVSITAGAQSMTYNHDPIVMNQFMKAEIGSGTLGAGYFWAEKVYYGTKPFHKDYADEYDNVAHSKMASRTLTNAEVTKEEKYAETIKDSLEKRAEIEALNMVDRQFDIEWEVEKSKIKRQESKFKKNIEDIVYYGGTQEDKNNWTMVYNMIEETLDSAHDAYMPNSQRKSIYIMAYKDLCMYNATLNKLKNIWWAERSVRENQDKTFNFTKSRSIIKDCYGRWKIAWAGKKGNSSGGGTGAIGIDAGNH